MGKPTWGYDNSVLQIFGFDVRYLVLIFQPSMHMYDLLTCLSLCLSLSVCLSYSVNLPLRIGLLDIFGFESFERNSFEQVNKSKSYCIYILNEVVEIKLQLKFFTQAQKV